MGTKRKAFTLTEMGVVLAVIGAVLMFLPPVLTAARAPGRHVVGLANMQTIGKAFHAYCADFYGITPPSALPVSVPANFPLGQIGPPAPLTSTGFRMWYAMEFQDASGSQDWYIGRKMGLNPGPKWWGVGCLYQAGYVDNQKIFYSPGVLFDDAGEYSEFNVMNYTEPTTGKWVWRNYPQLGTASNRGALPLEYFRPSLPAVPSQGQTARQIDKISNWPFLFDEINSWNTIQYKTANGDPTGINTLYGDGHAAFRTDKKLFDTATWIQAIGMDPWNKAATLAHTASQNIPGHQETRFLPIYLALCDLNPNSIQASQYMLNNEIFAHFWK